MTRQIFECQKCGQCCEGAGGIVLGPKDRTRLSRWLGLSEEALAEKYCETTRGKLVLTIGADGFCVFFRKGHGCVVHEAKPDICRAWPWFRGNLEDEQSFFMAREFCRGIDRGIPHHAFVEAGKEYLRRNGVMAAGGDCEANSLLRQ